MNSSGRQASHLAQIDSTSPIIRIENNPSITNSSANGSRHSIALARRKACRPLSIFIFNRRYFPSPIARREGTTSKAEQLLPQRTASPNFQKLIRIIKETSSPHPDPELCWQNTTRIDQHRLICCLEKATTTCTESSAKGIFRAVCHLQK